MDLSALICVHLRLISNHYFCKISIVGFPFDSAPLEKRAEGYSTHYREKFPGLQVDLGGFSGSMGTASIATGASAGGTSSTSGAGAAMGVAASALSATEF